MFFTLFIFFAVDKIENKRALIDQQPFKSDIQNIKEELTKLNEKFEKKLFKYRTFYSKKKEIFLGNWETMLIRKVIKTLKVHPSTDVIACLQLVLKVEN